MKPDLLIIPSNIYPATLAILENNYTCHHFWRAENKKVFLDSIAPKIKAAVTNGNVGMAADLIGALPHLQIIACFGVGVDAIDLTAAKTRRIQVTNTPDVLTDDVADLAIGLMLAVLRKIVTGDRFVRSGAWLKGPLALGEKVGGKTLGIIGLGRIGKEIAHRAEAFKLNVVYHGPRQKPDVPYQFYSKPIELAYASDILIVACPGSDETKKIISTEVIEALGPQGILINISRGSVIDQPALITALKNQTLGGAGLDVFIDEPNIPPELFAMEHVVLQPHQGSGTHATREAMGQCVINNLTAFFSNKSLLTPYS